MGPVSSIRTPFGGSFLRYRNQARFALMLYFNMNVGATLDWQVRIECREDRPTRKRGGSFARWNKHTGL